MFEILRKSYRWPDREIPKIMVARIVNVEPGRPVIPAKVKLKIICFQTVFLNVSFFNKGN